MSIDLISGSQLKILLKRRGIKINDLVEEFNFNRITISRYFNDRNPIPAEFIVKVAAYANLSLHDLIEGGFPEAAADFTAFLKKSNSTHCYSSTRIFSIGDRFSIFL